MGLGPPVCVDCKLVMRLSSGGKPPWHCPLCKRNSGQGQQRMNLWELPAGEQAFYEDHTDRLMASGKI